MRLEGKSILISGGNGRLGRELVPLLKKEGASVMSPAQQEWDCTLRPCGLAMPTTPDMIIHFLRLRERAPYGLLCVYQEGWGGICKQA